MSSRRNIPDRRPDSTMNPASALTSSLRHASVAKSAASVTTQPPARRTSATRVADAGTVTRGSPRSRTQPPGWVSAPNQMMAGTTVDRRHSGWTSSICSTPFCMTHTVLFSSHSTASQRAASSSWVALTARITRSTGPLSSPGSVCTGPGTMIGSAPSGRTSNRSRGVRPHSTTA